MNTASFSFFRKILVTLIFILLIFSETEANSDIDGKWCIEINIGGLGIVRTFMQFEAQSGNNTFTAYTRQGAVQDFTAIYNTPMAAFLGQMPNGSIIRIDKGEVSQGNTGMNLKGSFISLTGTYNFEGNINNDSIFAALTRKDKSVSGFMNGYRITPGKNTLLSDYRSIINNIVDTTEKNIFSADMTASDKWKDFKKHLTAASGFIQDDTEMAFAFFYFAQELPFSHFNLTRDINRSNLLIENLSYDSKASLNAVYSIKDYEKNTCYLKINSFSGTSQEIDSLFKIINEKNYKNLIIDLRENQGGNLAAGLRTAQYLVKQNFNGGIFLTRKWFDAGKKIPASEDYKNYPSVSEANQELLMKNVHEYEAVNITAESIPERFTGNIFVLTSKKTASACEPFVHGLKESNSAVIIGEKTAGSMLIGERFDAGDEFVLTIPTADFYTPEGARLDGVGVVPNISVSSSDALDSALKLLK
jgi:hypothetical protein